MWLTCARLESNVEWVKTLAEQGWQMLLRFYGPLETYFDHTRKPDDIVSND